jgi:integrase/recombinase XerD
MKKNRAGQATALDETLFFQILDGFRLPSHKLFWAIAWYTGERPGAILKLRTRSVYLDPRRRLPSGVIVFPGRDRKCRVTRECPVSRKLAIHLRSFEPPQGDLLFPSPLNESAPLTLRTLDAAFRRAIARKQLGGLGLSLYSARRGFLTTLAHHGVDLRTIQTLSGHKSLAVLGRYIDVPTERRIEAINLV